MTRRPHRDSDSPELLLTATIAAIWGLSSFGFGLLSVAKEVRF